MNKSIQFLLLPVYIKVFNPSEYGKLELIYMVIAILNIANGLLVQNGYARLYFDNDSEPYRKKLFGTAMFFMVFFTFLINGTAMIFSEPIAAVFLDFEEGEQLFRLLLISVFIKGMANVPYKKLVVSHKAVQYISVNFSYVVLALLFTIYFVVHRDMGVAGVLYAQIIGASVQIIALGAITFNIEIISFNRTMLNDMLKFSIFLILPNLSTFLINLANRFFLEEYQGLHEVGIYSLGARIASIIPLILTNPFKKVFGPHIYSLARDTAKCKAQLVRYSSHFLLVLILLSLFLSLFTRELIELISADSYRSSYIIVPLLSLSHIMYGFSGIIVLGIHIAKKTKVITLIFLVSSIISLLFNYLLIPEYGIIGAAIANILSIFIVFLGYIIAVRKYYPITLEYGKYVGLIAGAGIIYLISIVEFNTLLINVFFKVFLFSLFVILVFFSNYLSPVDKSAIKRRIRVFEK